MNTPQRSGAQRMTTISVPPVFSMPPLACCRNTPPLRQQSSPSADHTGQRISNEKSAASIISDRTAPGYTPPRGVEDELLLLRGMQRALGTMRRRIGQRETRANSGAI
ncbi:uncharacterized protein LOC143360002 [Halictus rubicundus]|uniref:uncharacterized protein LOC143360002 n=1 Tax=Halictus rubicundus TaxID=77578 RepID=UPI0040360C3A